MSECSVCLTIDDWDGSNEFSRVKIVKAAKEHRCSECDKIIARGEKYERVAGKFDGEMWSEKTCLVCAEIADAFYCEGRMYGGLLWESMEEVVFPVLNTACFDRLQTAAAKAELVRRWNEWKFS